MVFKNFWEALGFGDFEKDDREEYYEESEEVQSFVSPKKERTNNLVALKNDKVSVVVIEPTFEEAPIIADTCNYPFLF